MPVGSGSHRYERVQGWPQLPADVFLGWIGSVGVDSQGRVYCFCRGTHPMVVFDAEGRIVDTWGDDLLNHAHGVYVDSNEHLWLTDRFAHVVWVTTTEGRVVRRIGYPNFTSADGGHFNPPHQHPSRRRRLHLRVRRLRRHPLPPLRAQRSVAQQLGRPGTGPGQFDLPHGIWALSDDRILVADRENHRIQIFDPEGAYMDQWTGFRQPSDFYVDEDAGVIYLAEVGGRVSLVDLTGQTITSWEDPGDGGATFSAPHGIWVDPDGAIYMGEVQRDDALYKFQPIS